MNRKTVFTVTLLIGLYIGCQAVADVAATKIVQIWSIVLPAGSLIYAVTFTVRDVIHKRLGKDWARAAIVVSGGFNVIQAAYLAWMATFPTPPYYQNAEAWNSIFAVVPAITIGSILAEVISELTDTEVYHFVMKKLPIVPQWGRVLASNAVSLPLDSFIFGTLAFVLLPPLFGQEGLPFVVAMGIVGGQIVWKAIVTVVSLPTIYFVREGKIDTLRETNP